MNNFPEQKCWELAHFDERGETIVFMATLPGDERHVSGLGIRHKDRVVVLTPEQWLALVPVNGDNRSE